MAIAYAPATVDQIGTVQKRHHRARWIALAIILLAMLFFAIIAAASPPQATSCGAKCPAPPPPLQSIGAPATYHSSAFGYSVSYDPSLLSPDLKDSSSVGWIGTLNSGGKLEIKFTGQNAGSDSAEQLVSAIAGNVFPQFNFVYALPGAEIGYIPGYGAVYDGTITPPGGQSEHRRVSIVAAIRRTTAITLIFSSPFHADDGSSFPDPAELSPTFSQFTDDLISSVIWK